MGTKTSKHTGNLNDNNGNGNSNRKGDSILLAATIFWGASYYFSDVCLEELGPITLTAWRFFIAFILLLIFMFPQVKKASRKAIVYGVLTGAIMAVGYFLGNMSLIYTGLSNSTFLQSLPVIITPIIAFIIYKRKPKPQFTVVVLICVIGIALLTLTEAFKLRPGDLIAISASIFYASFLLLVEYSIQKKGVDAIQLGIFMQGTVGIISLIFALIFEHPKEGGLLGLIAMPQTSTVWWMLGFLTIFCSAVGFIMQTLGQKYTTAERAGVIFAIEPVFAGIVAFIFAGEVLSARGYIGAGLIVFSLFMMEMDFKKIFGKLKKSA